MKHIKVVKTLVSTFILVALLAIGINVAHAAFGLSPSIIVNDHVKAGTELITEINVSNDAEDKDVKLAVTYHGDEMLGKWVTVENKGNLKIKAGEEKLPVKVIIDVPKDAELRRYLGQITVDVMPEEEGKGVQIALGASIDLDITVIDYDIYDFSVGYLTIPPVQEGDDMVIDLLLRNHGNMELSNVPVEIDVWDSREEAIVATVSSEKLRNKIGPYESEKTSVMVDTSELTSGDYWGKTRVYKDDTVIFDAKSFIKVEKKPTPISEVPTSIKVVKDGEIVHMADEKEDGGNSVDAVDVDTTVKVPSPYERFLVPGVIILVVIIVAVYFTRRKK